MTRQPQAHASTSVRGVNELSNSIAVVYKAWPLRTQARLDHAAISIDDHLCARGASSGISSWQRRDAERRQASVLVVGSRANARCHARVGQVPPPCRVVPLHGVRSGHRPNARRWRGTRGRHGRWLRGCAGATEGAWCAHPCVPLRPFRSPAIPLAEHNYSSIVSTLHG